MAGRDFTVTILRFVSACGSSPGFRLDTVLNNCGAGIPGPAMAWRQLIHVRDMARAIEWAVARPSANGGSNLVLNVGSDAWTWRAFELAELVGAFVPEGSRAAGCGRVDFTLFRRLAPLHQPREKPANILRELKSARRGAFRVHQLMGLVEQGRLTEDLRWQAPVAACA
jgi:nucleoside-diphosphate-sugar epimerase